MAKKIGALLLVLVMVLVMGTTAFAAESLTGGKVGDDDPAAKLENSLTFYKEIVLFNTTSAEVHHPAIQYTYTIAGATNTSATVTDEDSDVGVVYAGVGAGEKVTITSPVVFSNSDSETAVTPDGKVASQPVTVTVDPTVFTHAGIYRYLISEGDNSTGRTAAGVSRGNNYVSTRYLDVYVRRAVEGEGTGFVVYGYVLFEGSDTSITNTNEAAALKSQGFVATETSTGVYGTDDVDYYETYNLKVTKNIEGALAETSHEFPFSVAFTSPVTTDAVIEWAKGTATTDEATITGSALTLGDATTSGYNSSAIKLADNEYVTFYGIPASTTAVVSEINDTYDIYTASQESITGGTSTAPDAVNIAAQHVDTSIYSITAVANATTTTSNSEIDTQLQVKNEIAVVSPTGIVLRVAPYVLMLGAGIFLLFISRRRKKNDDKV